MAKKYKCVGCGEYKNDEAYDLYGNCENEGERQVSEMEKEYGEPKEIDDKTK